MSVERSETRQSPRSKIGPGSWFVVCGMLLVERREAKRSHPREGRTHCTRSRITNHHAAINNPQSSIPNIPNQQLAVRRPLPARAGNAGETTNDERRTTNNEQLGNLHLRVGTLVRRFTGSCARIAQLDRASDYGSEGSRFNSWCVHHLNKAQWNQGLNRCYGARKHA